MDQVLACDHDLFFQDHGEMVTDRVLVGVIFMYIGYVFYDLVSGGVCSR